MLRCGCGANVDIGYGPYINQRKEIYGKLHNTVIGVAQKVYAERIFHNLPSPFMPDIHNI